MRIGSLNVRVKKTTEAFNNLLGSNSGSSTKLEKLYSKQWGSIDGLAASVINATPCKQCPVFIAHPIVLNQDGQLMPPPSKHGKKKRSQPSISLPMNFQHTNQFTCPPVQEPSTENKDDYKTDSDSEYGFGNGWQS